MSIVIELPQEILQRLREEGPDLEGQAKENMLVELYRQDRLSHRELGVTLGLDRFQTDALLKKHKVTEDLPTREEYEEALVHLNAASNT